MRLFLAVSCGLALMPACSGDEPTKVDEADTDADADSDADADADADSDADADTDADTDTGTTDTGTTGTGTGATSTTGDTADPAFACVDASLGSALPLLYQGSTVGAGNDDFSQIVGGQVSEDVFLDFTAPYDGQFAFYLTPNTDFDALLYMRTQCGGNEIAATDVIGNGGELLALDMSAGQTVLIVVDGWDGYGGTSYGGNFELSIDLVPATELICGDGLDQDFDGDTDCFDADCAADPICGVEICGDGVDNDADFSTDCFDADCDLDAACAEICDDGIDNDGDFSTDCFDEFCDLDAACTEICDDGIDNDGDGDLDCLDVFCAADPVCAEVCDDNLDDNNTGTIDCADLSCAADAACQPQCPDTVALGQVPETLVGEVIGEYDEVSPSCVTGAGDVQISYTAPQDGDYVFDLAGSDFDTSLVILDQCGGTELGCNDDWLGLRSQLVAPLTAGQTVIVSVDSFSSFSVDEDSGNFQLNIALLEANETVCDDGRDLDNDDLVDCADPDCTGQPVCAEVCDDGIDNDFDGDTDCFDTDCAADPICGVEICGDGVDNDADFSTDCFDADCAADPICGVEICDDGIDNDTDFSTDCFDADCDLDAACAEICDDGIDNDGDFSTDCFDEFCDLDAACAEICDDGIDNDGDGDIDCLDAFCAADAACAEICDDGIDNDGDGDIDCLDAFCAADALCANTCPRDVLGAPPQTLNVSTVGLPNDYSPQTCGFSNSSEYTWEFTAPAAGTYTFDTFGSNFDTVLYAQDGACGGAEIACNDDTGGLQSEIVLNLVANQTVIIIVDGYSTGDGDVVLNVQ